MLFPLFSRSYQDNMSTITSWMSRLIFDGFPANLPTSHRFKWSLETYFLSVLYGIPTLYEDLVRLPSSPFAIQYYFAREIFNRFLPIPQLVQDNLYFFVPNPPCYNVAGDGLFLSNTTFIAALAYTTTIL